MASVGIDLGTTNSLVGVWKEEGCMLIPNSFGEYLTPSVVSAGEGGEFLVGRVAKERLISHPGHTAGGFKRFMGTGKEFLLAGRPFRPEELSALVLRQLRQDAERFLGEEVLEAVISVPAYFNDCQRTATKLAGQLAGLRVNRIINEPSAAALAYQKEERADGVYLVIDFGGGTLDISLVEMFEDIVDILAIAGDNQLGGQDIDAAIVEAFLAQNPALAQTLGSGEAASLRKVAEQCKIALTTAQNSLMIYQKDGQAYSMKLDNPGLRNTCAALLGRLKTVLEKTLRDAGRPIASVNGIVLVGGSCTMPLVKEYIRYLTGKPLLKGIDPNQAVALGAAMVSGIKARSAGVRDFILTDICPFSLGIKTSTQYSQHGQFSPIISRNSALPVSRSGLYTTLVDKQKHLKIKVYQGEALSAEQNLFLGELQIQVPPLPAGHANVEVRFTYDLDGILEVEARCLQDGNTEHTVLVSNSSLSPAEVQSRIQKMQALKMPKVGYAENQLVFAMGERLFEEHSGELRQRIADALEWFRDRLEVQANPASIAKLRAQVLSFFEKLNTFDAGLLEGVYFEEETSMDGEEELEP